MTLAISPNFLVAEIAAKSVAELQASDLCIDSRTLTGILKSSSLTPTLKAKCIALGARVDARVLTLLITQLFKTKAREGVEVISSLVDRMLDAPRKLLLDLALESELFELCAFKRRTFAADALEERLFYHTKRGNVQAVDRLLCLGVNVDAKDKQQKSALYHATLKKNAALSELLIAKGASKLPHQKLLPASRKLFQRLEPCMAKLDKDPLLSALSPNARQAVAYFLSQTEAKDPRIVKMRELTMIFRNQNLYLLPKDYEGFKVERSCKKATLGIKIPRQADLSSTKVVRLITKKGLCREVMAMCRQEAAIFRELQGEEGIYRVNDSFEHDGRFWTFSDEAISFVRIVSTLTRYEQVQVIKSYLKGLINIHKKGIIHGDLNSTNCLVRRLSDNTLEAGWIDFGLSFYAKENQLNTSMNIGFYGTIAITAPELFGVENFSGDLYKVEVYALGCMLYMALFIHKFPWHDTLYDYYERWDEITENDRTSIKRLVAQFMQSQLAFAKDPLQLLLLKMMRPNPDERITLQEALNEILLHEFI
jgi:serine/threonine protein kinase